MWAWPCEVLVARRCGARTSSSNRPDRLEEILRLDPPPDGFSQEKSPEIWKEKLGTKCWSLFEAEVSKLA
jgi:hypothetical protein